MYDSDSGYRGRTAALAHHAHILVVEVHDLDREPVLLAGRELLDAHLNARFAGDAGDRRARVRELHTHGRRQAEAHGAQAPGVDPAARLVEFVELRRPHLVLADVGSYKCIAFGDFVESLEHELRLDDLAFLVVFQAVLGFPQPDLDHQVLSAFWSGCSRRPRAAGSVLRARRTRCRRSGRRPSRAWRSRRVDVDVNDLALHLGEMRRIADDPIIEARADGKQNIAVLHRMLASRCRASRACQGTAGRLRIASQAHERIGARETEQFDELGEPLRRIGKDHPPPV